VRVSRSNLEVPPQLKLYPLAERSRSEVEACYEVLRFDPLVCTVNVSLADERTAG